MDDTVARIQSILDAHRGKDFVERIIDPTTVPALALPEGRYGTHMMSYADDGNGRNAIVYPEIVRSPETGGLVRLERDAAKKHALSTGQYIPFDKSEDAAWFAQNYKKTWEGKFGRDQIAPTPTVPIP